MTNLEKVEKDIRQKLPRLMDPTHGCIVDVYGEKCMLFSFNSIGHIDGDYRLFTEIRTIPKMEVRHIPQDYEYTIIGHDPTLNDVLEWLGVAFDFNDEFTVQSNGLLLRWDDKFDSYELTGKRFDLSKPYLKDQPQELIDYLAGLI